LNPSYDLAADAEISLEANPGSLRPGYLAGLRAAGVNRLSLGVQSASPEELRLLERQHAYEDVIAAVLMAREEGFENLNLDLIFALPGQSLAAWQHNLELSLELHPEHFSLYALTIEHGTPFQKMADRGLLPLIDPDLAADMYEWAMQRLAEAGYEQYEISNWARRRDGQLLACRHNLQYWRNLPYIGMGAGAHGFVGGHRTVNVLAPAALYRSAFRRTAAGLPAQPGHSQRQTRGRCTRDG
jgi:oxygen-independent coproporphyrinogen-3 oxidase